MEHNEKAQQETEAGVSGRLGHDLIEEAVLLVHKLQASS